MKRKFLLFAFLLASTLRGHAQDATSALNKIMSGFAVPLFIALTLFAVVLGLSQQWDNIIDKENRGTRRDGLFAIAWYVGYALLAGIVTTGVKAAVSGIDLSI